MSTHPTKRTVFCLVGIIVIIHGFVIAGSSCRRRSVDVSKAKATPEQRRVIGPGVPYLPEQSMEKSILSKDMRLRRQAAWDIFRQVTKEVEIGKGSELKGFRPDVRPTLPVWQTWYTSDELPVMLRDAYERLSPEHRIARRPICPETLDEVFVRHSKQSVHGFTQQELEQRLSQVRHQREVRGVSGRGVTLFSPAILRHYMENYVSVVNCPDQRSNLSPGEIVSQTNHSSCFSGEFPSGRQFPYTLPPGDYSHCKNPSPLVNHGGAVALKTTWHKVNSSDLAVFDTGESEVAKHILEGEWKPNRQWPEVELSADRIYSIKLMQSDSQYHLASMHVVTKDTRDWMWITFWWSPEPDSDFGEDRPKYFNGTAWANYKMCVVTDYVEHDIDPARHFDQSHPSLARAIRKVHDMVKPHTWCSSPFTEAGKGNSRTNCIGCHQHGGTSADPDEIFLDDPTNPRTVLARQLYPHGSRSQLRANFPGDYLWSYSYAPDFFETLVISTISNVDNGL